MEAADSCEIARLPEELLSTVLSLATPRDACRAAAVCREFRVASDSDAVWACFVPHDLPPLADGELSGPAPASNKGRFLRLSDCPVLLAGGLTSMWLDRESGAKCYMLSARALHIAWGDTPRPKYWSWIPLADSRFSEGAQLLGGVRWLEIWGNLDSKILSQSSTYAAYFVFKIDDESYGLDYAPLETSITVAGSTTTRKVCLQSNGNEHEGVPGSVPFLRQFSRRHLYPYHRSSVHPQERADGWMELEIGEFYHKNGDDGEVCFRLMEVKGISKGGLIVHGIEIRPKKDLAVHSSVRSLRGEAQEATESMTMANCDIMRLPVELLSDVISRTTPWDTCRAATVSKAFHTAADSDGAWSRFLSAELMPLLSTYKVSPALLSMKDMFLHFSDHRVLLAEKLMSMWFDRETGAKCYMLSARNLNIASVDKPKYWRWVPITGSSFSEAAEVVYYCRLKIRGKIDSKMLSQYSPYAAYIVFKLNHRAHGFRYPYPKTSINLGRCKSTRRICLYDRDADIPLNVALPRERADGWKELEMGEFYNDGGEDGEVSISLLGVTTETVGLVVQGIEIRPRKQRGH